MVTQRSPSDSTFGDSGRTGDQPAQTPGQIADQLQQQASQVAGQALDQAKSQIATQKDRAAEGLGSVADALRQTGQSLRKNEQAPFADIFDEAATRIDRFSDQIQRRDVEDLMMDVEHFARRQPGLFIGGAFAIGLVVARFLKSSGGGASYGPNVRYGQNYGANPGQSSSGSRSAGSGYGGNPRGYDARNFDTRGYDSRGSGAGNPGSMGDRRLAPRPGMSDPTGSSSSTRTPSRPQRDSSTYPTYPSSSPRPSSLSGREEK